MTRPAYVIALASGVLAVVFLMLPRIQSASADWVYCVHNLNALHPGQTCTTVPGDPPAGFGSGGAGGGSETPVKSMKKVSKPTKSMKKTKLGGECPPGQTDQLEAYKGICVDPKLIDPETGRLKEASRCPPGQTDQLEAYKGICMDPKLIDPETRRLKEASRCPPGQTDQLEAYKGICMDPKLLAP